jgi:hypothetical protein
MKKIPTRLKQSISIHKLRREVALVALSRYPARTRAIYEAITCVVWAGAALLLSPFFKTVWTAIDLAYLIVVARFLAYMHRESKMDQVREQFDELVAKNRRLHDHT